MAIDRDDIYVSTSNGQEPITENNKGISFAWWVQYVLRKCEIILLKVKDQILKMESNFGTEILKYWEL